MATARGRVPARFDDGPFGVDTGRYQLDSWACAVAEEARRRLEAEGVAVQALMACDEEGRDRTRLGGLLKLYLPLIYAPADERPFGMVFDPIDTDRGIGPQTTSRSGRTTSRRARTPRPSTPRAPTPARPLAVNASLNYDSWPDRHSETAGTRTHRSSPSASNRSADSTDAPKGLNGPDPSSTTRRSPTGSLSFTSAQ